MHHQRLSTSGRRRFLLIPLTCLALLPGPGAVCRAQPPAAGPLLARPLTIQEVKTGPLAKLGGDLAALAKELEAHEASGRAAPFASANSLLPIVDERVAVDAVAAPGATADLHAALEALGLERGASFGPMVSGLLPVGALQAMAGLAQLRFARPAYSIRNVGDTTSQGDPAMRSDDGRSTFVIDGTGVKVGSMSDSYDCLGGAAGDVGTGDLPAGVTVLMDACPGTDEGRALMQLIRDVAPGASQLFHTAGPGQAGFATGIMDLETASADVIVDDVIFFAEPMFQDGIIAQAVDAVFSSGTTYFSAAGNNGRDAHEDSYRPGTDPVFSAASHDWNPGGGTDFYQALTIPEGATILAVFQWDEPAASASGGSGSASDVDIYLLDDPPTVFFAAGLDPNLGGDPAEVFGYTNPMGSGVTSFNLYINLFSGPAPSFIKYVLFNFEGSVDEYFTASGTLYGHANANGAEAVGASAYFFTPEFGTDPPLLNSTSSAGPTPILFDLTDSPIMEIRPKPEIVGPDGGNTTFFGVDIPDPGDGSDTDTFPNFFGTSASAPHAAGVAALMKDLGPGLTPSAIRSVLEASAHDMGPPGFDDDSGFGFIDALDALESVAPSAPDCGVDDLFLDETPNTSPQTFRACKSITFGPGTFNDIDAFSPEHIFTDGFESGDTSSWSSSVP